jgi:hypothetical protein
MNTNRIKLGVKSFCMLALTVASTQLHAQQDTATVKNVNREMTLEREYDPTVQDASKINTLPVVKEPEVRKMRINYANFTSAVEPTTELNLLGSGDLMTPIAFNNRRGYFNFGAGTYLNMNGDLGYHILSTEKDKLGIYFTHRSTNGDIKSLQTKLDSKAKLNDNLGVINYKHEFDALALKLAANYGYTSYNYYGSFPSEILEYTPLEENIVNKQFYVAAGVESKKEEGFNYSLDLNYRNFLREYATNPKLFLFTEHAIGVNFDLNASFSGDNKVGLKFLGESLSYTDPVSYPAAFDSHTGVTLNPYFAKQGVNWNLLLGANVMFVLGATDNLSVSPNIKFDATIADETVFYANLLGDLKLNSAYQMSMENRYINPAVGARPSTTWMDGTIGIKSGILPNFWFDVFAGYKATDEDHFYWPSYIVNANGPSDGLVNALDLIYANSRKLFTGVSFKYSYQQLLNVSLKGVYNAWSTNGVDVSKETAAKMPPFKAYNRPSFEFNAGVEVNPIKNLSFLVDYNLGAGRYAQVAGENVAMKNINELNLKGTYTFNKTFGVYAHLNNLLFQKYDLYYGYASQGFNVMAGVNINF